MTPRACAESPTVSYQHSRAGLSPRASGPPSPVPDTCDETAASVVACDEEGRGTILSNEVLSQIAKALRLSAEVLYVRAGILEPSEGSQVHDAIIGDTAITERQKQVLLDIYTSFCQQNEAAREELTSD